MTSYDTESMILETCHKLDAFRKRFEEKVYKDQQQLKALKKTTEVEKKIAQEKKKHAELSRQLEEVTNRCKELDQVCHLIPGELTISDNDQNRLDQAKFTYEVAKEFSGVRFDYSAPPNVCKGYVKSESRMLLKPFNLPGDADAHGALWQLLESVAAPEWGLDDKENPSSN